MQLENDTIQIIGTSVSMVALFFIFWQIRMTKNIAKIEFEDSMNSEYRNIIEKLPIEMMLGKEVSPLIKDLCMNRFFEETNPSKKREEENILSGFYRYFDLTNEQLFLILKGRISIRTGNDWMEGMQHNLRNPNFEKAYELIVKSNESFRELKYINCKIFQKSSLPKMNVITRKVHYLRLNSQKTKQKNS